MKVTPVKGTNDYLPREAELRDYLQRKICETYENCGFQRIFTPILEDIENLDKSEGGENLNLIFKVMKRGAKLEKAMGGGDANLLADMGLRYDLTLPLSRYYANNRAHLASPFKVIQIDRVYRAERPQKGRLREFMQCDIDILGSESPDCEVELIHTTAKALMNIGIEKFTVHVNDRRILREVLLSAGFEEKDLDSVCITFDKMDKIGIDGIRSELQDKEFAPEVIDKFTALIESGDFSLEYVSTLCRDSQYTDRLADIIQVSRQLAEDRYEVVFDMTLVRGQGYYTGTVFEIRSDEFGSSIAGGGRYDNLIGKFVKDDVPAVGFSIGFERIFSILTERETAMAQQPKKVALIYEEKQIKEAILQAEKLRGENTVALFIKPKKLGKLLNRLEEQGYDGFVVLGRDEDIRLF